MTDAPIRWAVLGPGNIARRFAEQLGCSRRGVLAGIASRDRSRAEQFAADFGVASTAVVGDYNTVLASTGVDAVYVSTVHTSHARLAIAALRAGKHVLCEKPLAVNFGQVMTVVDEARRVDARLVEAYMYRFHPQTVEVLRAVREGEIGQLVHVDASFAFGGGEHRAGRLYEPDLAGGGILDVGGYPVSYARAIAGAAAGTAFLEPDGWTADGMFGPTGVDEWAIATLTFPGAMTAALRAGIGLQDQNTVTILGSAGKIELSDPWTLTAEPEMIVTQVGEPPQRRSFPGAHPYALEADALADSISGDEPTEMSTDDALGNAQALDRWRAAIRQRYPFEADDAELGTVSGMPLQKPPAAQAMPAHQISGLNKSLSRLVMGCDNQPDLSHASALFDQFFGLGGNVFDTAYIYGGGRHENLFGRWVTNRGIRDEVVIITKGAHTPYCDPESLSRQLIESLERQGTEYADIYLMHRDNPEIPVGEFVDVLDEYVRQGRITVFGGSNWSLERFDQANAYATANGRYGFSVLSNHFGLAEAYDLPWPGCRHVTDAASRQWLTDRQIPLLPWSSQARGFFARADPVNRSDAELVRCYYSDANFERMRRAEKLAADAGVPTTAIALAYVLNQPFPTFPLFGPRSIAETRSSLPGLNVILTTDQMAWLDLRSTD